MSDAAESAAFIQAKLPAAPRLGVTLGTGLGPLAEQLQDPVLLDYSDIPGFPRVTAPEHVGQLVCGTLHGCPTVLFRGRPHGYEGYDLDALTFFPRVLHALGGTVMVLTNASGGVNPDLVTGDVVVMADHIDLLGKIGSGCMDTGSARQPDQSKRPAIRGNQHRPGYDAALRQLALQAARHHNYAAYPGTYAALLGPSYETRSEYRMLRRLGADCVGMSTVPEAKAACELGLRVLGLSTITNVAKPDAPRSVIPATTSDDVAHGAASAAWKVMAIIEAIAANV